MIKLTAMFLNVVFGSALIEYVNCTYSCACKAECQPLLLLPVVLQTT